MSSGSTTSSPSQATIILAHAVSRLLGWCYFTCWSVSFYPQILLNTRRRSVTGLSLDFCTINVLGFLCYTVSSILFLFSPIVRNEYARRHPDAPEPTVRWNDLAFATHALIVSAITLSQFYIWGYSRDRQQRLSNPIKAVIVGCLTTTAISVFMVDGEKWQWLDVAYTLATIKLAITLLKYLPQALLNQRRKSTIGWSIYNILLDYSGGLLSLLQLVVDASLQGDWSGLIGNPVKFFLSQITMVFDVWFLVQHYVLYRRSMEEVEVEVEERRMLIGSER